MEATTTTFKLTVQEREFIEGYCKTMGLKMGEFIRQSMFEKIANTPQNLINIRKQLSE